MKQAWIIALTLLLLRAPAASAQAVLSVDADPSAPGIQPFVGVPPGPFTVDIDVSNVADLFGYQFSLAYDPSVVSVLGVTEGPFLSAGGSTFFAPGTINTGAGTVAFTDGTLLGTGPGVDGTGTLASLRLVAIGPPFSRSPLTLSDTMLLDSLKVPISFTSHDGRATVVPEPSPLVLSGLGLLALAASRARRRAPGRNSQAASGCGRT